MSNASIQLKRVSIISGIMAGVFALAVLADSNPPWTAAPASPPSGNPDAPINVGDLLQTKTGFLNLSHVITSDLSVINVDKNIPIVPGQVLASMDNTGKVGWVATTTLGMVTLPALAGGPRDIESLSIGGCSAYGPMTKDGGTPCPSGYMMCGLGRLNDDAWDQTQVYCESVKLNDTFYPHTGPVTGLTCSVTDSFYNEPTSIAADATGGSGSYVYQFSIDGGAWTAAQSGSVYSSKLATGSHVIQVNAKAVPVSSSLGENNGAGKTVTCTPNPVKTDYKSLDASRMTCKASVPSYLTSGSPAVVYAAKTTYTVSGSPIGGTGTYYYKFGTNNPSASATIDSSDTLGATNSGYWTQPTANSSVKSTLFTYKDIGGSLIGAALDDVDLIVSDDAGHSTTVNNLCNAPAFSK